MGRPLRDPLFKILRQALGKPLGKPLCGPLCEPPGESLGIISRLGDMPTMKSPDFHWKERFGDVTRFHLGTFFIRQCLGLWPMNSLKPLTPGLCQLWLLRTHEDPRMSSSWSLPIPPVIPLQKNSRACMSVLSNPGHNNYGAFLLICFRKLVTNNPGVKKFESQLPEVMRYLTGAGAKNKRNGYAVFTEVQNHLG